MEFAIGVSNLDQAVEKLTGAGVSRSAEISRQSASAREWRYAIRP
jgi:hypothetical protein